MSGAEQPWRRWVAGSVDVALTLAAVQLTAALTRELTVGARPALALAALVVSVAHASALVVRRLAPRAVAAWLLATAVVYTLLGIAPAYLGPAGLIGLYTVTVRTPRTESLRWLAATEIILVAGGLVRGLDLDSVAMHAALALGAWVLADQVHRRQDEAAAHAERARQLEIAREELAEHAVMQERLRIARELHDVLAHSMGVIALNAGAGRMVAEQDPARARAALQTIEQVTRGALAELRQLTSVLREEEGDSALAPLPGLKDLPALVAGVAATGLVVDVRVEGSQRALADGLDLAVYRIIQEALTNTMKHSAAGSCAVVVRYGSDVLDVTISDPGPARTLAAKEPVAGSRSGLLGMRERVAMHDGRLDAGPTAGGGFRVRASLPTAGPRG